MKKTVVTLAILVITCAMAAAQDRDSLSRVRVGYMDGEAAAGQVDRVSGDQVNKGLGRNTLESLNGQAAGVTISRGNSATMLNAVRVRGTTSLTGGNDPLVIIDGVASDLSTLNTIYPADIESFTILKDASQTAQYGSRGAAGVIEVQTRKGRGEAFSIVYEGTLALEAVSKTLGMMNAEQYRSAAATLGKSIVDLGYNTDFQRAITRPGFVQNHHVAFGGGSDDANYRASIGIQDHNSIIQGIGYKNYIAKIDMFQKAFGGVLEADLGLTGSLSSDAAIHDVQKLFYSAASFNPTFPSVQVDGGWPSVATASQINNPMALLEKRNDTDDAHFNVHLSLKGNIAKGLSLTGFMSYTYSVVDCSRYFPTSVWSHGQAYRSEDKTKDLLANLALRYSTDLGRHHIDLLALSEASVKSVSGFCTTVTGFSTDAYTYNNLQAGTTRPWDGTASWSDDPKMLSFMAQGNYSFAGKYILSASVRADGSSKFGANHKWGVFPSVSAAWDLGKEEFIKNIGWIDDLKISAGYGMSGSQASISSFNSLLLYSPGGVVSNGGVPAVALGYMQNLNPDLKWEVKHTVNVGLSSSFFAGRLAVSVDWYRSKTTDMLYSYSVPVPPYPYDSILANLGSLGGSGVEIGMGGIVFETADMALNVNMNLAFQRSKLISLSGWLGDQYMYAPSDAAIAALDGAGFHGGDNNITYTMIGQPLGIFYLPHCKGLISNGDGTYSYDIEDLDDDGSVEMSGDDRYIAGQAQPKALLGANISFRWRAFDVAMQVNGAFGHKIYNGTALTYMNIASLPDYNVLPAAMDYMISDQTISDWWLEKGDYVNIDYITLGWNAPLRDRFLKALRLSLSVGNLATITSYSGLTPMINSSVVDGTLGLDDKRSYPVYRSWSLGVSLKF